MSQQSVSVGEPEPVAWRFYGMDKPLRQKWWLHILLFALTFISVSYAGAMMQAPPDWDWADGIYGIAKGVPFACLLLGFLTAHEFGHYLAARRHGVRATLPFFIPMPLIPFGTMGAVIRIRSVIPDRKVLFDIGSAGPLAGFVLAFAYLVIGMLTVPGRESLYQYHPHLRALATIPEYGLHYGDFLLFYLLKLALIPHGRFFPPMNMIQHYPLLCVGWFGMFVTSLNLLPVGQLDGGHILYAMYGRVQHSIGRIIVWLLLIAGAGGATGMIVDLLRDEAESAMAGPAGFLHRYTGWWLHGWPGWLLWALMAWLFFKVKHPPLPHQADNLDNRRLALGWLTILIFLLTFSYNGLFELSP